MKKIICLLLILCLLVSLSGCRSLYFLALVAGSDDGAERDEIFAFVREHEDALLRAVEAGDFSAFENQGFIKSVQANGDCVEFSCGGAGVGSGTSYVGFYYTADHDLTAVWGASGSAQALTAKGSGFEWQEPDGDNYYYTEQICGNFYYYEVST